MIKIKTSSLADLVIQFLNKIDRHFKKNKNLNFNTFNIFDKMSNIS